MEEHPFVKIFNLLNSGMGFFILSCYSIFMTAYAYHLWKIVVDYSQRLGRKL